MTSFVPRKGTAAPRVARIVPRMDTAALRLTRFVPRMGSEAASVGNGEASVNLPRDEGHERPSERTARSEDDYSAALCDANRWQGSPYPEALH